MRRAVCFCGGRLRIIDGQQSRAIGIVCKRRCAIAVVAVGTNTITCFTEPADSRIGAIPLDTHTLRAIVCAENSRTIDCGRNPKESISAWEHGIASGGVQGGNPVSRRVGRYPIHCILKIAVSSNQLFRHRSSSLESESWRC
jgi:hypothetical protein